MNWLIASAERTLTEEVPAPPVDVRNFYTDLNKVMSVHPLVVSVRATARTETADGYVQTYRVQDRIPLGPLTMPISYVARLSVPEEGDVIAEARQFPRVRLHSSVTFERIDGGTRVSGRMQIEAPKPLARVTMREAFKAHIAMLAGIRRHFEQVG